MQIKSIKSLPQYKNVPCCRDCGKELTEKEESRGELCFQCDGECHCSQCEEAR